MVVLAHSERDQPAIQPVSGQELQEYARRRLNCWWNRHHTPNIAFLTRSDVISLLLTRLEIKALLDDPDENQAMSGLSSVIR